MPHSKAYQFGAFAFAMTCLLAAEAQPSAPKEIPTLAQELSPSVVRIILRDQTGGELGSGSGFVISEDGKVVTNYHVIHLQGTTQAEARFTDGASYQLQGVLATDPDKDLALAKLLAPGKVFPFVRLGDSDRVRIGEHVLAIGSPLAGLSPVSTEETVSDGIVSGIRDWPDHQMKVFQITAPISPGSSGGALVNSDGQVIGVTFAQLVSGQNLNFAIPAAYVQPLLSEGPLKSLASINSTASIDSPKPQEYSPTGSYAGTWQSDRFTVSGAAQMTVSVSGDTASASVFLTGGEVTSANLSGTAHRSGDNIWTVVLHSKKPTLTVRGIFRDNSFVGDYTYTRFLLLDKGRWILKKEH